jgi:hypothetical protein
METVVNTADALEAAALAALGETTETLDVGVRAVDTFGSAAVKRPEKTD